MEKVDFANKFYRLVENSDRVLITSHKNPDDDSISAVLTTYYLIKENYPQKHVEIMYAGEFSNRWSYFENFDKIKYVSDINSEINKFDLAILLDASNEYERVGLNKEVVYKSNVKTINIDHHDTESNKFDLSYCDKDATSTAEILYKFFIEKRESIPQRLAEINLLGIVGDTGSFTFIRPQQTDVFSAVQRLIKEGNIFLEEFKSKFMVYPKSTFLIIQEFVKNVEFLKVNDWPEFLCTYITSEFIKNGNFSDSEVKEASNIFIGSYGKVMSDVSWGISIYPSSNGDVRVSMRSRVNSISVNHIAVGIGYGGGHHGSSAMTYKSSELGELNAYKVKEMFINWLKNNEPTFRS